MENEKTLESIKLMNKEFRDVISEIDDEQTGSDTFFEKLNKIDQDIKESMMDWKNDITKIYEFGKNMKTKNTPVNVSDVNILIVKYKEYFDGLKNYMKDLAKKSNSENFTEEDNEKLIVTLKSSIIKDENFPDSCIEYKDTSYQDAINNLECVLELVHMIYVLKTEVIEIFKYPIKDNDIKKFSNHLVECSVVNFLYKTWYEISHTKYVLTDVMNGKSGRPSVDTISDDTDNNFKMF